MPALQRSAPGKIGERPRRHFVGRPRQFNEVRFAERASLVGRRQLQHLHPKFFDGEHGSNAIKMRWIRAGVCSREWLPTAEARQKIGCLPIVATTNRKAIIQLNRISRILWASATFHQKWRPSFFLVAQIELLAALQEDEGVFAFTVDP